MRIHIVQKGDTLFEIAKNYQVELEDIIRLNPQLSSPDLIMPGMKIKIPSESKQIRNESNIQMREARTTERPMGEVFEDEDFDKKRENKSMSHRFEPLYPVRPVIQPPKMKPMTAAEKREEQFIEEKKAERKEDIRPQVQYRPMTPPPRKIQSRAGMSMPRSTHPYMMQPMNRHSMIPSPMMMCPCCCMHSMMMQPYSHQDSFEYHKPHLQQRIQFNP